MFCFLLVGCITLDKAQPQTTNQEPERLVLVAGADNLLPENTLLKKPSEEDMSWELKWNNVTHTIGCEKDVNNETVFRIDNTDLITQKGVVVCMYFLGDSISLDEGIINNKSLGIAFLPSTCDMVGASTQKQNSFYTLPIPIMERCLSVVVDDLKNVEKEPTQEDALWEMPLWCYGEKNLSEIENEAPSGEVALWEKKSPTPCPTLTIIRKS